MIKYILYYIVILFTFRIYRDLSQLISNW